MLATPLSGWWSRVDSSGRAENSSRLAGADVFTDAPSLACKTAGESLRLLHTAWKPSAESTVCIRRYCDIQVILTRNAVSCHTGTSWNNLAAPAMHTLTRCSETCAKAIRQERSLMFTQEFRFTPSAVIAKSRMHTLQNERICLRRRMVLAATYDCTWLH